MKKSRNKGITLIALVITIIVMLILVAVTVNMTINGGLFNYANKANEGTKDAMTEERIKLSVYSAYIEGNGTLNYEKLITALQKEFEEGNYEITPDDNNAESWTITVGKTEVELKNENYVAPTAVYAYKATSEGATEPDTLILSSKGDLTSIDGYKDLVVYTNGGVPYDISKVEFTSASANPWYDSSENSYIKYVNIVDEIVPTYCERWFTNCKNLEEIKNITNLKTNNVVTMNRMFMKCSNLTDLDVSKFETNSVTDMENMFYDCPSLKKLDVDKFDTRNVTNMNSMFFNCSNLNNLNVSNFNTSKVTNMSNMFNACQGLSRLDLNKFDTQNVNNMSGMFANCTSVETIQMEGFNTRNVTNMDSMFFNCTNLNNLNVSNFNTEKVTNMHQMFCSCPNIRELNLSSFDVKNVDDLDLMFAYVVPQTGEFKTGISKLKKIYTKSNWIIKSGCSSTNMFAACDKLVGGNGTTYNSSKKDASYARIDTASTPGYFTLKN